MLCSYHATLRLARLRFRFHHCSLYPVTEKKENSENDQSYDVHSPTGFRYREELECILAVEWAILLSAQNSHEDSASQRKWFLASRSSKARQIGACCGPCTWRYDKDSINSSSALIWEETWHFVRLLSNALPPSQHTFLALHSLPYVLDRL